MQVPYNFQQVIDNNQYQIINGVKCFPVSMLDENFNYLCNVVTVGSTAPEILYDGQLWFNGTILKIAQSSSWVDIKVANAVNADKLGNLLPSQFLRSDQNTTCSGSITAQQFVSTTTSTPPLVVNSNQLVTNLCADYLDGYHLDSTSAVTGQLVQFDTANVKLKPVPVYVVSGNVGVGITSPAQKLHVAGNIGIQAGANVFIGTVDNYNLSLRTNNTDRIVIDTSGRVGIGGVTSPQASLHVGGGESVYFGGGGNTYPTTPSSGSGAFVGKGGYSDFRLVLSDGSGRVNMYWNAYCDSSTGAHKYIVSNEPACRFLEGVNGSTGCLFQFFGAPAGTAGNNISWTQVAEFASGANVWLSPKGVSSDFFISSSGNVGIGTTSPGIAKLNIANQGTGVALYIGDVNTAPSGQAMIEIVSPIPATHIWTQEGSTRVFSVTSGGSGYFAGNVGIGRAPSSYKLDVAGDIRSISSGYVLIHSAMSDSDPSYIRIMNTASTTANPYVNFGYGSYTGIGSIYLNISDKSLRLNISKTLDGNNLRDAIIIPPANGTQTACIIPSWNGGYTGDWPSGWGGGLATYDISCGSIYYNGLLQRSDASIKTDIQSLSDYLNTDSLDVISCLKPVKYVYVNDPLNTNRFGFIAQDVSEVCPELVTIDTEGKASLNYMDLIALLTRGIQELYEMLGKVIEKIGGIS
jgi:hypothetical protein